LWAPPYPAPSSCTAGGCVDVVCVGLHAINELVGVYGPWWVQFDVNELLRLSSSLLFDGPTHRRLRDSWKLTEELRGHRSV